MCVYVSVCVCVVSGGVYVCVFVCDYLHVRGTEGLSSFEGIQIFWILFWVSSLGIPLGLGSIRLNTAARYTPASAVFANTSEQSRNNDALLCKSSSLTAA